MTALPHVRGEERSPHVLRHAPKIRKSERQLVHPDRGGAITHRIHETQVAPVLLLGEEVRPALVLGSAERAPRVEKENVRMLATELLQYGGAPGHAARLIDLAAARFQKPRAVSGIGKGQTANDGATRRRGSGLGGRQREIRLHRRERAAAHEIAPEESPQRRASRQRLPKRRSRLSSVERGQDAIEAASPRRAELVIQMDQDEGSELRARERRALGARIEVLEILLDAAGVEAGEIALGEAATHIVLGEPARRGDGPPRIPAADSVD